MRVYISYQLTIISLTKSTGLRIQYIERALERIHVYCHNRHAIKITLAVNGIKNVLFSFCPVVSLNSLVLGEKPAMVK